MLAASSSVGARRVDAVEVGMRDRRARDAQVHLARARLEHHLHDLLRRGAAHHAVVDQHDAVAAHGAGVGGVLELDAELADALLGLDEGAADVVVADDAELEGDAALLGVADGGGHAGVRDRDDRRRPRPAPRARAARPSACGGRRRCGRRRSSRAGRSRCTRRCRAAPGAAGRGGGSRCRPR